MVIIVCFDETCAAEMNAARHRQLSCFRRLVDGSQVVMSHHLTRSRVSLFNKTQLFVRMIRIVINNSIDLCVLRYGYL